MHPGATLGNHSAGESNQYLKRIGNKVKVECIFVDMSDMNTPTNKARFIRLTVTDETVSHETFADLTVKVRKLATDALGDKCWTILASQEGDDLSVRKGW